MALSIKICARPICCDHRILVAGLCSGCIFFHQKIWPKFLAQPVLAKNNTLQRNSTAFLRCPAAPFPSQVGLGQGKKTPKGGRGEQFLYCQNDDENNFTPYFTQEKEKKQRHVPQKKTNGGGSGTVWPKLWAIQWEDSN